jgi:hypothetical protein
VSARNRAATSVSWWRSIGGRVLLAELLLAPEQAGVDGVEDRPQLAQPVLDRRAGERQLLLGAELARTALAALVAGFFTICASSSTTVVHSTAEVVEVARQQPVGGDDDVGVGQTVGEQRRLAVGRRRVGAVVDDHPPARGEAVGLGLPVVHDAERADHQVRAGPLEQVGERGGGLAETHVVGEAPAESDAGEELHPRQTAPLVVAQLAVELGDSLASSSRSSGSPASRLPAPSRRRRRWRRTSRLPGRHHRRLRRCRPAELDRGLAVG